MALSWVCACLIIHSLVSCMEDFELEADFQQWVADGLHGHPGYAKDDEVEGFSSVSWGGSIVGESEAQCKHWCKWGKAHSGLSLCLPVYGNDEAWPKGH